MKQSSVSIVRSISVLESLFSKFNDRYFSGELMNPVITISPDTTKGAYGWCTSFKAWKSQDGCNDGYYEINICADYLNRDYHLISATLLHEMVHLYNLQHGIKDCSRGGTYHNEKFKTCAESHGLIVGGKDAYGWHHTELTDDSFSFLDSLTDIRFDLFRDEAKRAKGAKTKQSTRKYVCPCCGMIVRATKEVNVICGDCNEVMQVEL